MIPQTIENIRLWDDANGNVNVRKSERLLSGVGKPREATPPPCRSGAR